MLDEHPDNGLAPVMGTPRRAEYYQWCVFSSAELDTALSGVMLHTMHLPHEQRVPAIAQRGRDRFAAGGAMLSHALENRDYLLDTEFSGANIVIGYSCNWAAYAGLIEGQLILVDYYARLQQSPAFQKAFASRLQPSDRQPARRSWLQFVRQMDGRSSPVALPGSIPQKREQGACEPVRVPRLLRFAQSE